MVEDSDSYDEDEAIEKQESDPNPPPAPPGFGMPPPPPSGFEPPPPPVGFPSFDLPGPEESQPSESLQTIDHEAARRMLLGLEDEENLEDDDREPEEESGVSQ